jgi:hypothetical protein
VTFPGGTGQQLDVMFGSLGVVDAYPSQGQTITLGSGNDTVGVGQSDTIIGGTEDDFIDGSGGNQSISGGRGAGDRVALRATYYLGYAS